MTTEKFISELPTGTFTSFQEAYPLELGMPTGTQTIRFSLSEQVQAFGLKPYITGLGIEYLTSGSLSILPGAAYIPGVGGMVLLNSTTSVSITPSATTVTGSWQHLYIYNGGSLLGAVEASTTVPSSPYAGVARTKSGDTSRRYIGSVYCDAGGYLFKFNSAVHGNVLKMNWMPTSPTVFPFRVALGVASDTPVTLPITHLVPVTGAFNGLLVQVTLALGAAGDLSAAVGDSIPSETVGAASGEINLRIENAKAAASMNVFLPPAEIKLTGSSIQYITTQNAGSSTIGIRIKGVNIQR